MYELPYFENIYSRSGAKSQNASEDVIGYTADDPDDELPW